MKTLTTTAEVIEALGGDAPVAWMFNTTKKCVSNWRCWRKFPSNSYVVFEYELRVRGFSAPPKLWMMKQRRKQRMRDNVRLDAISGRPL